MREYRYSAEVQGSSTEMCTVQHRRGLRDKFMVGRRDVCIISDNSEMVGHHIRDNWALEPHMTTGCNVLCIRSLGQRQGGVISVLICFLLQFLLKGVKQN